MVVCQTCSKVNRTITPLFAFSTRTFVRIVLKSLSHYGSLGAAHNPAQWMLHGKMLCNTSVARCIKFYEPRNSLSCRGILLLYMVFVLCFTYTKVRLPDQANSRHDNAVPLYVLSLLMLELQAQCTQSCIMYALYILSSLHVLRHPIQQSSCSVSHAFHADAGAVTSRWGFVNEVQAHKAVMLVLHIHPFLTPLHIGKTSFSTKSCHCTP